jgi:hypothetical protein
MTPHRLASKTRPLLWLPTAAVCLLLAGCDSEPKTYPVSGTVSFNGQPLKEGDISFHPSDPAVSADAGKILDGEFHFHAKAGAKRVEIRVSQVVPGRTTPMGGPLRLEIIPAQYNDESKLAAHVSPDGGNEYEFKLEGKR